MTPMVPRLTLPGTPIQTTQLGFGCNSLLGPKPRREGLALLGAAYDAGIRHFDVARAYSSGDAEGLVGEFLAGKRDQVTITTKFGLLPPKGAVKKMGWLKPLARAIMRLSPRLRQASGKQSSRMVEHGAFSPEKAKASFEVSLRELKTDRVDLLLMHEAAASDCTPELLEFLQDQQRAGRIGAYGAGSNFSRIQGIIAERPSFAKVVQFESGILKANRESLGYPAGRAVSTHGGISAGFSTLRAHFAKYPETCKKWSDSLGLDLANAQILASLLLAHSVLVNPDGIVLFSSTRAESIRENARAIFDNRFPSDQVRGFAELVRSAPL